MNKSALATLLIVAALAASCAERPPGPPLPVTTGSLLDDYVLVHGLAAGAVFSPGVSRAEVGTLVQLDRDAVLALRTSALDPGSSASRDRAQQAIARLADYAARTGTRDDLAPPVQHSATLPVR